MSERYPGTIWPYVPVLVILWVAATLGIAYGTVQLYGGGPRGPAGPQGQQGLTGPAAPVGQTVSRDQFCAVASRLTRLEQLLSDEQLISIGQGATLREGVGCGP